jgi:glycine/D-amino acid oxidase-like deaminating enzyme
LKFLGDEEMRVLKAHPWLDTVLAARRKAMGKIDDLVSVYPDDGRAMRGWCERAAEWLRRKGVDVSLGEKILALKDGAKGITVTTDKRAIEADKVLWANDNVTALSAAFGFEDYTNKLQSATPMVFATLITRAAWLKDFTYLQNFDPGSYTYRTAAAGVFSNQVRPDGTTFITCECPIRPGSDRWDKAETLAPAIWAEVKALGIVKPEAVLLDQDIARFPVTFKMPKTGFTASVERFKEDIAKRSRRVVLRNVIPFFRRDVYLDSLTVRGLVE